MNFLDTFLDSVNFDLESRQMAKKIFLLFSDTNYHIMMAFFADVLFVLSIVSKDLQLRGGVLIGQKERTEKLKAELLNLKKNDGTYLTGLMQNLSCVIENSLMVICPREYIIGSQSHSEKIKRIFHSEPINPDRKVDFLYHSGKKLSESKMDEPNTQWMRNDQLKIQLLDEKIRTEIIDDLLEEINNYFPNDLTEAFSIFSPEKIQLNNILWKNFASEKIGLLAKDWHLDNTDCIKDFRDMISRWEGTGEFAKKNEIFLGRIIASASEILEILL